MACLEQARDEAEIRYIFGFQAFQVIDERIQKSFKILKLADCTFVTKHDDHISTLKWY